MTKASDLPKPYRRIFNWTAIVLLFIFGATLTARVNTPIVQEEAEFEQAGRIELPPSIAEFGKALLAGDPSTVSIAIVVFGGILFGAIVSMGAALAIALKLMDNWLQHPQHPNQ